LLGKNLVGLQLRRGPAGPKRLNAYSLQRVDPDNGQTHLLFPGEIHQGRHVVVLDRDVLPAQGGAGVARGDVQLAELFGLPQLPRDRVLASPAAYQ